MFAKGLTQEQLAHDLDLDVSYLGQIERGERNTTLVVVEKAATVLGVSPASLLDSAGPSLCPRPPAAPTW